MCKCSEMYKWLMIEDAQSGQILTALTAMVEASESMSAIGGAKSAEAAHDG